MRLVQVCGVTDWGSVREALCCCYLDDADKLESFGGAYAQIPSLQPTETTMQIYLEADSDPNSAGKAGVNVFGKDGSFFEQEGHISADEQIEACFNLSYMHWEEWLGMEISPDAMDRFTPAEVVAHCLWEMTYLGFSIEVIRRRRADLDEQIKEMDDRK